MNETLGILIAEATVRNTSLQAGVAQSEREPETRIVETFREQTTRLLGVEVIEAIGPVLFYHRDGWLNEAMSFVRGGHNFCLNRCAHQFVTLKNDGGRLEFVELNLDNPEFKYQFLGALGAALQSAHPA
jgi:hypothetical protein